MMKNTESLEMLIIWAVLSGVIGANIGWAAVLIAYQKGVLLAFHGLGINLLIGAVLGFLIFAALGSGYAYCFKIMPVQNLQLLEASRANHIEKLTHDASIIYRCHQQPICQSSLKLFKTTTNRMQVIIFYLFSMVWLFDFDKYFTV